MGGTKAVSASHELQMAVMIGGIVTAFIITLYSLPQGIGFTEALHIAGANGRLNVVDFSLDWDSRYTFWSGITGGTFLALAYFGTDQSQAQRYISGQSVRESRMGMTVQCRFSRFQCSFLSYWRVSWSLSFISSRPPRCFSIHM